MFNRLKGLSERHKLSCFLSGLKDEIRLPIQMLNPINLNVAFGLAKILEEYLMTSRRSWKGGGVSTKKGFFVIVLEGNRVWKPSILVKKNFSSQMNEKGERAFITTMM